MDYEKYYKMGLYEKVRPDRFDSQSEKKVCIVLNRILQKYEMDQMMNLRLTPQQPIDNYVIYSGNEEFSDFHKTRHKWMRFDFIFEKVFEWKNSIHYIPVAVVEFDGPYHSEEKQKKLDAYKNGIVANIGASIVRIKYQDLDIFTDDIFTKYEDDILSAIIKGYFTKTSNYRKSESLINESSLKQFHYICNRYEQSIKGASSEKIEAFSHMLKLLYFAKETMFVSAN